MHCNRSPSIVPSNTRGVFCEEKTSQGLAFFDRNYLTGNIVNIDTGNIGNIDSTIVLFFFSSEGGNYLKEGVR